MTDRPNILFLMTDQQRGDCLGIDGRGESMTARRGSGAGRATGRTAVP